MSEMGEMTLPSRTVPAEDCTGCGSCLGRRDFLKVGLHAAALTALVAALPGRAAAAPVRATSATRAGALLRYPVPPADGVDVDREHEVILVRNAGRVMAFALSCPHQRSMLRWRPEDGIFQCTKHHSEYSPTGEFRKGRATRNMDRLAIRLEGTELVVDPDTVIQSDENAGAWASAAVPVS
jgi:nitrite reductase/ring-hydroxylating ferredoxin subunit